MTVFNLGDLSRKLKTFAGHEPLVITRELLITAGLLGKNFTGEIKVLGVGDAAFPIALDGIKISKSAKEKMEKANHK